MNVWLVLLLGGILTYLTRLSFIFLLGIWEMPSWMQRCLRYVPPAVMTALIFPELFIQSEKFFVSFGNVRLFAGHSGHRSRTFDEEHPFYHTGRDFCHDAL